MAESRFLSRFLADNGFQPLKLHSIAEQWHSHIYHQKNIVYLKGGYMYVHDSAGQVWIRTKDSRILDTLLSRYSLTVHGTLCTDVRDL